jgi:hypothetical protein
MAGYYGSGDGLAGYEEVTFAEARTTVRPAQPRAVTSGMNGATTVANDSEF